LISLGIRASAAPVRRAPRPQPPRASPCAGTRKDGVKKILRGVRGAAMPRPFGLLPFSSMPSMKRWLTRLGLALGAVAVLLLVAVAAATVYSLSAYRKTWDVPLPATRAVDDPAVIARGEYLV